MFNFFNEKKVNKIGYEDVLYVIKNHENYLFINTLSNEKQDCLIKNSLTIENEVTQINFLLEQQKFNIKIVIYGEHSCDPSIDKKYKQLKDLGFNDIYIYSGGLFEWLLLQDIYGNKEFPTTKNIIDILKYRPKGTFNILRLT